MNRVTTVEHVVENGTLVKRLTSFDVGAGTTHERVEQETGEFPALELSLEPEAGREHVLPERAPRIVSRDFLTGSAD